MTRPKELALAITFTAAVLLANLLGTVLSRASLGDGWILLVSFRVFVCIFGAVLLILAYNGNKWIRIVHALLFALAIAVLGRDADQLADPWLLGVVGLHALALVFWFHPRTNRWYRHRRAVVPERPET